MIFYFSGKEQHQAPEAICGHASVMLTFFDIHGSRPDARLRRHIRLRMTRKGKKRKGK